MDVPPKSRAGAVLDREVAQLAAERPVRKSSLVRDTLIEFAVTEGTFAEAIAAGRAAVDAGDVIDHDEVMREIDALLARKE